MPSSAGVGHPQNALIPQLGTGCPTFRFFSHGRLLSRESDRQVAHPNANFYGSIFAALLVAAHILLEVSLLEVSMSSLRRRIAVVTDRAANLIDKLRELDQLRDRVRKARLSARRSRPINHRKGRAHCDASRVDRQPLSSFD
jgi:hypothetical protein